MGNDTQRCGSATKTKSNLSNSWRPLELRLKVTALAVRALQLSSDGLSTEDTEKATLKDMCLVGMSCTLLLMACQCLLLMLVRFKLEVSNKASKQQLLEVQRQNGCGYCVWHFGIACSR